MPWSVILQQILQTSTETVREDRHFCCLFHGYKKKKIFSEKQKGFRDGLCYSTPQKSKETRGNAITQPWSHPIKKM